MREMLTIPERFYLRLTPSAFIIILCCMLLLSITGCRSQTGAGQPSPATQQQQQQSSSQSTTVTSSNVASSNSNSPQPVQNVSVQNSNTSVNATATGFDTCSLLTPAEVGSVQGDEITGAQAAPGNSTRLAVSQCYYQAKTSAKSVSIEVTRRLSGRAGALSPREFWEERFEGAEHERERERKGKPDADKRKDKPGARDEGEEEEGAPPQKVAGIGDEAFWAGNRVMGALYVLKGNTIVRISIGGVADQSVRLEKTKALARLALKRLKD
jgi:hypothetical protein